MKHLIASILILSFIFGFDDKRPEFIVSLWLLNFVSVFIVVSISLIIHELMHKITASKFEATTDYRLWSIKRYGFARTAKLPKKFFGFTINNFYIGAIIGIILTIVSMGKFIFAAIGQNFIEPIKIKRIGYKLKSLSNYQIVSIALIGPLTNIFLALIFSLINFKFGVFVNSIIAIYSMLPLPKLDGSYVLFNAKFTYLFFAILIGFCAILLLQNISAIVSVILAIIIASIITMIFLYKSYK